MAGTHTHTTPSHTTPQQPHAIIGRGSSQHALSDAWEPPHRHSQHQKRHKQHLTHVQQQADGGQAAAPAVTCGARTLNCRLLGQRGRSFVPELRAGVCRHGLCWAYRALGAVGGDEWWRCRALHAAGYIVLLPVPWRLQFCSSISSCRCCTTPHCNHQGTRCLRTSAAAGTGCCCRCCWRCLCSGAVLQTASLSGH